MFTCFLNSYNCNYFRKATAAKYTRNWKGSKVCTGASGQESSKVKNGGMAQRSLDTNNRSKSNSVKYPALDCSKSTKSETVENPSVVENSDQKQQHIPPLHEQEKNIIVTASKTDISKTSTKYVKYPTNHNHHQDKQNGEFLPSSSKNKSYFKQPPADSGDCNKNDVPGNKNYFSPATSILNRKPPSQRNSSHTQHQNYKQQRNNQGAKDTKRYNQHNQNEPKFQHHDGPQKYIRNRYFARSAPLSSSSNPNEPHDQQHHTTIEPAADLSHTLYHQNNNRQCKYSCNILLSFN